MALHDEAGAGSVGNGELVTRLTRWRWIVYLALMILTLALIELTREPRGPGPVTSDPGVSTRR
jgi:hypothetical protein